MISVLSVNFNCLKWMELLVKSVRKFTAVPYEIVIIDNASEDGSREWLAKQKDVNALLKTINLGHGAGLDYGLRHVQYELCLVLDIDAHVQRKGWDFDLLEIYTKDPNLRLIAAKGGEAKPIHPCFMFFEPQFFIRNKLSFVPRDNYDVGRKIYPDILALGHEVFRVSIGYESQGKKFYPGAFGDEYYLNAQPTIYHNWYSARMWKKEIVDNYNKDEFRKKEAIVFNQPLVKEILAEEDNA